MYWIEENDGKLRMYSLEEFLLIPNAHLFGNPRVQETVQNGVRVSTVFLHVAHGARGGKPLLYETMVFGVGDDCVRRSAMVQRLQSCISIWIDSRTSMTPSDIVLVTAHSWRLHHAYSKPCGKSTPCAG